MSTFSDITKSSQAPFTEQSKDPNSGWNDLTHSDVAGAGFDVQTFDSSITSFDDAGNIITTSWSVQTKESG